MSTLRVLGIAGSLRKQSFNRALLRAAIELSPEGMRIEEFEIGAIPVYNNDIELSGAPESVEKFKAAIAASDALLIVTPEYNYSIPGVLKNAIDWASRPPATTPLNKKPVAIMSASTGMLGGARAQYHLRQVCVFTNMYPLNRPEVIVAKAAEKFDENLKLTDETTRGMIKAQLIELERWTNLLKSQP